MDTPFVDFRWYRGELQCSFLNKTSHPLFARSNNAKVELHNRVLLHIIWLPFSRGCQKKRLESHTNVWGIFDNLLFPLGSLFDNRMSSH